MAAAARRNVELFLFLVLWTIGVLAIHGVIGARPADGAAVAHFSLKMLGLDVLLAAGVFILIKLAGKLPTILELTGYLLDEGLWYLVPEVFVLLAVGALLAIAAAYPIVSPFIYTLF